MNKGLEFLKTTNWEYKEGTGGQYNIKKCPICNDDRWKFYMSVEDSLWDCKICGNAGNLYQLKAKLTGLEDRLTSTKQLFSNKKPLSLEDNQDYIDNLWEDKNALKYLKNRGFTKETIEHFKLGLEEDWLMIPHFQDGKLWNYKMRNYKEKEFRRVSGQPSVLYNIDGIQLKKKKKLIIVESETDTMAAWQLGIKNVVGLTTGAGTFPPEWVSFTVQFEEIYICLNSDAPGQKGAFKIAEKLGISKCKNVILPTNDINDFLKEHSSEEFIKLFQKAERFPIKNVKHVSEYINILDDWLAQEGSLNGLQLPFERVNKELNGFKEEDLIVLSGDSGVGKTTVCLNLVQHFAKNGHKTLIILLEGKLLYFLMRMMSIETGIPTHEMHKEPEYSERYEKIKKTFADYPIYFYSGAQGELEPKTLKEFIELAVNLYDIDFVMIDNLQRYVRDDKYATQNTSRAMSILKDIATDLKIPVLLVSHITKPDKDRRKVTMHDAKQSSTIYQVADIYLTIWNNKDPYSGEKAKDKMMLSIEKNRMGEGNLDFPMSFFKDTGIYSERLEEDKPKKKRKHTKDQIIARDLDLDSEIDDLE